MKKREFVTASAGRPVPIVSDSAAEVVEAATEDALKRLAEKVAAIVENEATVGRGEPLKVEAFGELPAVTTVQVGNQVVVTAVQDVTIHITTDWAVYADA